MNRDDHFRHDTHADHVRTHGPQHAVLGAGFQVRAGHADVNTGMRADAFFERRPRRGGEQPFAVRLDHVRPARPQALIVGADQRVDPHEVDLVFDDHDVAQLVLRVHAAGSAGDHQHAAAQLLQHAHGQRDLFERPAFVQVEAAIQSQDRRAGQFAVDHARGVGFDRAHREMRHVAVRQLAGVFDIAGQAA